MSNFIERDLIGGKAGKRGTKLERLLEDLRRVPDREDPGAEQNEEQEPKPAPRGLPAGFAFCRRLNH